jgi:phytoene dehydrogenase-like protein
MTTPRDDVVVVGAGLAGLTCAHLLERLGLSVRVLERGTATGGRIRTDVLSGYRCDRGFQLLNPAYPAVRELLDLRALDLRRFSAGVALPGPDGVRVVADPVRAPRLLLRTLRSGYARPVELARLAAWAAPALDSPDRLVAGEDSSLADSLGRAGVTRTVRRDIWDPFFAGVLAESDGSTSAQFARLLVRSFVLGRPAVPAAGMAALPGQISTALTSPVHLSTEVTEVRGTGSGMSVGSSAGSFAARAVVVAADPVTAGRLAGTSVPRMKGLATWWYAAAEAPSALPMLFLPSRTSGGPLVNSAVMTNVAPSYAPAGRHLIQATTLLGSDPGAAAPDERAVRRQLTELYGAAAAGWELVTTHLVRQAQPEQPPPLRIRRPVDLGDGLFVAGDHRDTASIQGAMVSGRRAARAVAGRLGVHTGPRS